MNFQEVSRLFRLGFEQAALEDGATTGQVPQLGAGGEAEFGDGGGSQPGMLLVAKRNFVETAGPGTYTASLDLPAGARLVGVGMETTADWSDGSASFHIGDESAANNIASGEEQAFLGDGAYYGWSHQSQSWVSGGAVSSVAHYDGVDFPSGQTITIVWTAAGVGATGRSRFWIVYWSSIAAIAAAKT